MKTLILNGSPRINGDTSSLIKKFTEKKIDRLALIVGTVGKIMAAQ